MAAKHKLTNAEKDEVRRLTQLANRRIKAATKEYMKAGKEIIPLDIVGKKELQLKSGWNTTATPLSRSVVFNSKAEYKKHLKFLKSFETELIGIKEFTTVQREKALLGIETSLGMEPGKVMQDLLNTLNAPRLTEFWKKFSDNAAKMGFEFSSNDNMVQTMKEFFPGQEGKIVRWLSDQAYEEMLREQEEQ